MTAFLLVAMSCAHHAPTQVDPATLPPLPRSSLAAVILHRSELRLSDDQVRELEELDRRRETEDAAARAELGPKSKPANAGGNNSASGASTGGSSSNASPGAGMGGGMNGGGMGGGRMGGMRGGRMGGGRGMRAPAGTNQAQRSNRLEDRLDDDDTKAYLDGEEVLTEPQRDQAREIASDYRAQLYNRRELLKNKANVDK